MQNKVVKVERISNEKLVSNAFAGAVDVPVYVRLIKCNYISICQGGLVCVPALTFMHVL